MARVILAAVATCLALHSAVTAGSEWHDVVVKARFPGQPTERPAFGPGTSFCLLEDESAPSGFQDRLVLQKIGRSLEQKRYVLSSSQHAQFCVFGDFGTKTEKARLRGSSGYIEVDRYFHHVIVSVVDGAVYRQTGETPIVWQGIAIIADVATENPPDPTKLIDILIVGVFKHFGKRRSRATVRIRLDDPRAEELRRLD